MTRLIIVRHGSTKANEERVMQGFMDSKLSELGNFQAQQVAKRLADEKIDVMITTDLSRARDTAEKIKELNNHFSGALLIEKGFREITNGVMDGKHISAFAKELDAKKLDRYNFKYKGGESVKEVHQRVKRALKKVLAEHKGKTIAIVGHALSIRMKIMELLGMSLEEVLSMRMKNSCVSTFTLQDNPVVTSGYGNIITESLMCGKHLEDVE